MLNLYMAMSGGNDWAIYYSVLRNLQPRYRFLFILFLSFCAFAVVNIVIGIFVDNAKQAQKADRDLIVQEELTAKAATCAALKDIFVEMDRNERGILPHEDFHKTLEDE